MRFEGIVYRLLQAGFNGFTRVICRPHIIGLGNVPKTGPVLIVSNHASWYDPLLLGAILPRRTWFFTKSELFDWPVIGGVARLTGQIAVRRGESDRGALLQALKYLEAGRPLLIFPEGTVERQGKLLRPQAGSAMLALRSGVPILPVGLVGTRRILRTWRVWFPGVTITIGEPYLPEVVAGTARKLSLQRVTDELMQRIAALLPPEMSSREMKQPLIDR